MLVLRRRPKQQPQQQLKTQCVQSRLVAAQKCMSMQISARPGGPFGQAVCAHLAPGIVVRQPHIDCIVSPGLLLYKNTPHHASNAQCDCGATDHTLAELTRPPNNHGPTKSPLMSTKLPDPCRVQKRCSVCVAMVGKRHASAKPVLEYWLTSSCPTHSAIKPRSAST